MARDVARYGTAYPDGASVESTQAADDAAAAANTAAALANANGTAAGIAAARVNDKAISQIGTARLHFPNAAAVDVDTVLDPVYALDAGTFADGSHGLEIEVSSLPASDGVTTIDALFDVPTDTGEHILTLEAMMTDTVSSNPGVGLGLGSRSGSRRAIVWRPDGTIVRVDLDDASATVLGFTAPTYTEGDRIRIQFRTETASAEMGTYVRFWKDDVWTTAQNLGTWHVGRAWITVRHAATYVVAISRDREIQDLEDRISESTSFSRLETRQGSTLGRTYAASGDVLFDIASSPWWIDGDDVVFVPDGESPPAGAEQAIFDASSATWYRPREMGRRRTVSRGGSSSIDDASIYAAIDDAEARQKAYTEARAAQVRPSPLMVPQVITATAKALHRGGAAAERTDLGLSLAGNNRFRGAVVARDGRIFCVPRQHPAFVIIDRDGSVTESSLGISLPSPSEHTWSGGTLGVDDRIYMTPRHAAWVLIIDPATNTATLEDYGLDMSGMDKWTGLVSAPNGKIYSVPTAAPDILVIDPRSGTATRDTLGAPLTTDEYKWIGGVLAPTGLIYCAPFWATDILVIDPATETAWVSDYGLGLSAGGDKWSGGALGPDGKIYFAPRSAGTVLVIDPETDTATTTDFGLDLTGSSMWARAILAGDGKIYCIPEAATEVLIIDAIAGTATLDDLGADLSGTVKWIGGILGVDGKIWCPPRHADDFLIITPDAGPSLPDWVVTSPTLNKAP